MSYTKRFILTPLDTVFFGDEKSPFKQEYFQKSRMMPQQTTALGMVRYEILRRSGLLGNSYNQWPDMIGKKSFNGVPEQTFGIIKRLSAVSVYRKNTGTDLYPLRNPVGFQWEANSSIRTNFGLDTEVGKDFGLWKKETNGESSYLDVKDHSQFGLVFSDLNGTMIDAVCNPKKDDKKNHGFERPDGNSIFWPDVRPGITKSYGGVPMEQGYFKTHFWRMTEGYAYSFVVEFSDKSEFPATKWKGDTIVRFGGDRCLYKLEIQDGNFPTWNSTGNVFVLQSNAKVNNNDIYQHCQMVVSDTRHFRNLRTHTDKKNWNQRPVLKWYRNEREREEKNTDPGRVLLKHGSILIAKDGEADALVNALKNAAFEKIGYNQYVRMNRLPEGTI